MKALGAKSSRPAEPHHAVEAEDHETETPESALDGQYVELGRLHQNDVITERGLAALFGRSVKSVKRAVEKGDLPPPARILGDYRWTIGSIVAHINRRLEEAAREADRDRKRIEGYSCGLAKTKGQKKGS